LLFDPIEPNGPARIIHVDDDQIVTIPASGAKTANILRGAQTKVYKGGSHGLAQVNPDTDVLAFLAFLISTVGHGRVPVRA
jgi:pimeloyl-ACP methyl ester carboxylesterase